MTRLIDADAIKNLEWITERGMADCGEEFVYMSAINEMPTVEAIPIDWIKKRIEDLNEYIGKRGRLFGQEAVANAKIHEVNVLVRLIADWQEERKEEYDKQRIHG